MRSAATSPVKIDLADLAATKFLPKTTCSPSRASASTRCSNRVQSNKLPIYWGRSSRTRIRSLCLWMHSQLRPRLPLSRLLCSRRPKHRRKSLQETLCSPRMALCSWARKRIQPRTSSRKSSTLRMALIYRSLVRCPSSENLESWRFSRDGAIRPVIGFMIAIDENWLTISYLPGQFLLRASNLSPKSQTQSASWTILR